MEVVPSFRRDFDSARDIKSAANALGLRSEGTWTPVLTCATPGDLNVVYSAQQGSYIKSGRLVIAPLRIITSTFTHTSASGAILVTGLPFKSGSEVGSWSSAVSIGGWTKAGHTQVLGDVVSATTQIRFLSSGTGVAVAAMAITDFPTAGTVTITGNIIYEV